MRPQLVSSPRCNRRKKLGGVFHGASSSNPRAVQSVAEKRGALSAETYLSVALEVDARLQQEPQIGLVGGFTGDLGFLLFQHLRCGGQVPPFSKQGSKGTSRTQTRL